jgi:DNA polymerase III subunit delta'
MRKTCHNTFVTKVQGQESQQALLRTLHTQALLFCGPSSVGRRQVAKWYGLWLNCENPLDEPCGNCASCQRFEEHPDYLEIQPQLITSTGRISRRPEIRIGQLVSRDDDTGDTPPLKRWLESRPVFKKRVGVIDYADTLNLSAANSFLKTLEEPPSHAIIILIAPSPQAVLPTIASRCTILRFNPVAIQSDHPTAHLGRIGDIEKARQHQDSFHEIMTTIDAYVLSLDKGLENAFEAADALEKVWTNSKEFEMSELLLAKLADHQIIAAKEAIDQFEESLEAYGSSNLAMQVLTLELRKRR